MLDLLFIALFQTVSGPPEDPQQTALAPNAQQQTGQSQAAPREQVRCRNVQITGSRISSRRCTTASQDEAVNQATAQELRDMQAQSGRSGRDE